MSELCDRADDVIETGGAGWLDDENIVRAQLIEPDAFGRRGEKTSQPFDGCGNIRIGTILYEVGTNPFRLRPQTRDRIMDAAVGEHGVDGYAAARIKPKMVGECGQPRRRLRYVPPRCGCCRSHQRAATFSR